jgi:hypothetical protein
MEQSSHGTFEAPNPSPVEQLAEHVGSFFKDLDPTQPQEVIRYNASRKDLPIRVARDTDGSYHIGFRSPANSRGCFPTPETTYDFTLTTGGELIDMTQAPDSPQAGRDQAAVYGDFLWDVVDNSTSRPMGRIKRFVLTCVLAAVNN